jgi:hypothetical protein
MDEHRLLLARILEVCRTRGIADAVQVTRAAFEAGQLPAVELPEILLALRHRDIHALGLMSALPTRPHLGAAAAA